MDADALAPYVIRILGVSIAGDGRLAMLNLLVSYELSPAENETKKLTKVNNIKATLTQVQAGINNREHSM